MKEFLQAVWGVFVLIVMVAAFFVRCESERLQKQRADEWQQFRSTMPQLKKAEPAFDLSKFHLPPRNRYRFDPLPYIRGAKPDAAPKPRAKPEVAPMPREVE